MVSKQFKTFMSRYVKQKLERACEIEYKKHFLKRIKEIKSHLSFQLSTAGNDRF